MYTIDKKVVTVSCFVFCYALREDLISSLQKALKPWMEKIEYRHKARDKDRGRQPEEDFIETHWRKYRQQLAQLEENKKRTD
jgi:hypothetical protein